MPIVGREFVVSGRDTSTLLDLVEKPFDQVARAIQQSASYPRSTSNIVCGSKALRRAEHSRLSCASPGVRARLAGRPLMPIPLWQPGWPPRTRSLLLGTNKLNQD